MRDYLYVEGVYTRATRSLGAFIPTSRRRTTTKLLRLHPEELARITARAEACGRTAARFIRERALGAMPKARHHVDTDRLLRALARIGRRLEQAGLRARSSGNAAFAEEIAALTDDHRALVDLLVSLRAPGRGHGGHSHALHNRPAAPVRALTPAPKKGRAEPSSDQLAIEFDPGSQAALDRTPTGPRQREGPRRAERLVIGR